jgi:predicted Fe-Mo cluster-binding NifX family protein
MKTAFAIWNNRIAPVFDVARQIHIVESESGGVIRETQRLLPEETPIQKGQRLSGMGLDMLVCGAISRPMYAMITAYGIRLIPFVAGNLHEAIHAYLDGSIENDLFAMPGCSGQGLRFKNIQGIDQMNPMMHGRHRGRGQRRGGWDHGR